MIPDKRLQIHQSGVEMAGKCGQMFAYRYIDGLKNPPSSYILTGRAVDKSAGCDLQNVIDKGQLLQESEVLDIARQAVKDESTKEEIALDAEEKTLGMAKVIDLAVDKSVRLEKCHHNVIAPQVKPVQVNRQFSIDMDGYLRFRAKDMYKQAESSRLSKYHKKVLESKAQSLNALARKGVDLVGAWDIRAESSSGKVEIRDIKTSKKTPSKNSDTGTYDVGDASEQLSAYALSSYVLDGQLPEFVVLDYLIDLKSETKGLIIKSVRTMEDIESFLLRVINLIHALHEGVFIPANPMAWWCDPRYCGYHVGAGGPCPYSKKPKSSIPDKPELVQIDF